MVVGPPLVLSLDGLNSSLGLIHARHGTGLDTFDNGGVEAIDRFLVFPLPAQCRHFLPNFGGCHDDFFLCWWIGGS